MIINSKFSSLYLGRKENWKASFDQDVCYMQRYAIREEIRIQFIGDSGGFVSKYISKSGDEVIVPVTALYLEPDIYGRVLYEIVFSVETAGLYSFMLTNEVDEVSTFFYIAQPEDLADTILLNYTHRKNEYDTIFIDEDGVDKRFNFRVEGGFYPGDRVQAVENEIFRDQRFEPFQTAAESYEISALTIGTKRGVPQWVGNKINSIFKLSDILIDGIETTRNESAIPELIKLGTYYPLYVFKMNVEQPDEDRIYSGTSNRIHINAFNNKFN
ncbi:hypothetical protein [Dysgonomonas sp. BGC7]|uniref:hypothetical protein n=1 Tax=Dysgonomonas sp. BGC7 TaxID=1658008 RepID=UPI00067FCFF1|nr:hypothetical protein [Dysgonomonas sp. BGC7]MBD8389669.1 hypothetical protein [Dysgonomonas sp. BGC7]